MEGRVGAKGGGRGDREKRGRAVSLWFSYLGRMRIYISGRKNKEVGRQMTFQEYRLGNELLYI